VTIQIKLFQSSNKNISLIERDVNTWLRGKQDDQIIDIRTSAASFGYSGNETFSWEQLYVTVIYRESQ
jgi:hypothetical protein